MAQSIGPHGVRRVADASGIASAVKLDARTISLAAASRFDSINTGWTDCRSRSGGAARSCRKTDARTSLSIGTLGTTYGLGLQPLATSRSARKSSGRRHTLYGVSGSPREGRGDSPDVVRTRVERRVSVYTLVGLLDLSLLRVR